MTFDAWPLTYSRSSEMALAYSIWHYQLLYNNVSSLHCFMCRCAGNCLSVITPSIGSTCTWKLWCVKARFLAIPWHACSSWLQIPTRSRAVVHLMCSRSVPSSNLSSSSQELTAVLETSTKSSAFVSLFFVSSKFRGHVVTDDNEHNAPR